MANASPVDQEPIAGRRPARLHHYIPKWRLAGFSRNRVGKLDRRMVWRFSKTSGELKRVPIRHAAVIRDYYALPALDGTADPEQLERLIARGFDGPASRLVRRRLLARMPLSDEERIQLAAYFAFLHGRVPLARNDTLAMMDKIATFMAYQQTLVPEQEFVTNARERGIEGSDEELIKLQADTRAQLKSGEIVVGPDRFGGYVVGAGCGADGHTDHGSMRWALLQAAIGWEFVLGDSPVTRHSNAAVRDPYSRLGLGFGAPDIEVRIPLTMNHALLLTHAPVGALELQCTPEIMRHVNMVSWRFATDYVFASCEAALRRVADCYATDDERRLPGGGVEIAGADLE